MGGLLSSPRRRDFLIFLGLWLALLVGGLNSFLDHLQAGSDRRLPHGVVSVPHRGVFAQDFSYQMIFFRGIRDHIVSRPYTLQGQEELIRRELPVSLSGMTHAYSPVAYVLALPLIGNAQTNSYLPYLIITAAGILLLFGYGLLPRVQSNSQLAALLICVSSLCLVIGLSVGQSAFLTVTFLGLLWSLLQNPVSLLRDISLALLFWALCLKPSVTVIPFFLLLGARASRPLLVGGFLLLLTWTFTCNLYGGWWTGLRDYSYLLNHYYNGAMGHFLQRAGENAASARAGASLFSLERDSLFGLSILLLFLRWFRRITPSEYFQSLVWIFLLFSPYLLPSEDWILCLLVVEGGFFKVENVWSAAARLLLLADVLDLRDGLTQSWALNFPCKCLLFGWILIDALCARSNSKGETPTITSPVPG